MYTLTNDEQLAQETVDVLLELIEAKRPGIVIEAVASALDAEALNDEQRAEFQTRLIGIIKKLSGGSNDALRFDVLDDDNNYIEPAFNGPALINALEMTGLVPTYTIDCEDHQFCWHELLDIAVYQAGSSILYFGKVIEEGTKLGRLDVPAVILEQYGTHDVLYAGLSFIIVASAQTVDVNLPWRYRYTNVTLELDAWDGNPDGWRWGGCTHPVGRRYDLDVRVNNGQFDYTIVG